MDIIKILRTENEPVISDTSRSSDDIASLHCTMNMLADMSMSSLKCSKGSPLIYQCTVYPRFTGLQFIVYSINRALFLFSSQIATFILCKLNVHSDLINRAIRYTVTHISFSPYNPTCTVNRRPTVI